MKCPHGHTPGPGPAVYSWKVGKSLQRKIAQHRQRCPQADPFWHEGFLFRSICCATCGRQIY